MSELYQDDILMWSERQSELSRRLASGEQVNDQVYWENVIEEVESVGSEQLLAVQSLLRQAFIQTLKAEVWPLSLGRYVRAGDDGWGGAGGGGAGLPGDAGGVAG